MAIVFCLGSGATSLACCPRTTSLFLALDPELKNVSSANSVRLAKFRNAVDDPGGSADDPGGGNIDNKVDS